MRRAQVLVAPGLGEVKTLFADPDRALAFNHASEVTGPHYYSVPLTTSSGAGIFAEMTATSRVGYACQSLSQV